MKIGNEITSNAHLLPATNANYIDGLAIFAYMNSTRSYNGYNYRTEAKNLLQSWPFSPMLDMMQQQTNPTRNPQIEIPRMMASRHEIIKEPPVQVALEDKMYVAVGKEDKMYLRVSIAQLRRKEDMPPSCS
ncbi:unnamed protein product [Camellia sinensis]